MSTLTNYALALGKKTHISMSEVVEIWNEGKILTIPENVTLDDHPNWATKGYYIKEGCARGYVTDSNGNEHTVSILTNPLFIAPNLSKHILGKPSISKIKTITPLKVRAWSISYFLAHLDQNPKYYKVIIDQLSHLLLAKNTNRIKQCTLTSDDLYLNFLEEYPGVANQIPLKFIASFLGMAPETISRIRNRLRTKS